MEVYKFLPKVRGGAQRAEGSVVEGKLLYYCLKVLRVLAGKYGFYSIIRFRNENALTA